MKRIIALLFALFIVLQLVSCGNEDKPKGSVGKGNGFFSESNNIERKSSKYRVLAYGYYNDNIVYGDGYKENEVQSSLGDSVSLYSYAENEIIKDNSDDSTSVFDREENPIDKWEKPSGDYYELVLEKKDSKNSMKTEIKMGVLKNNEWLVKLTDDFPFLENGWFKGIEEQTEYDELVEDEDKRPFKYIGQGVFMYCDRVVYNVETGVSFRIYGEKASTAISGTARDYASDDILGDDQTILTIDNFWDYIQNEYGYVDKYVTGEKPDEELDKEHDYLVLYDLKNGKKRVLNKAGKESNRRDLEPKEEFSFEEDGNSYKKSKHDYEYEEYGSFNEGYCFFNVSDNVFGFFDSHLNDVCAFNVEELNKENNLNNFDIIVDVRDCKLTNGQYCFICRGTNKNFYKTTFSIKDKSFTVDKLGDKESAYYEDDENWFNPILGNNFFPNGFGDSEDDN